MTVAAPLTTSNSCGGALQDSGGGALAAGDVGIRLTGGTIPASSSCAITVNVTAVALQASIRMTFPLAHLRPVAAVTPSPRTPR